MGNEKRLNDIAVVMTVLNLAVILYYCLICVVTTYRLCDSFGAYDFWGDRRKFCVIDVPRQYENLRLSQE